MTPHFPRSTTERTEKHAAVHDLLRREPVCLRIVRYLAAHNDAADTARGIAGWWIDRDIAVTERALLTLLEHGVVTSRIVQNGTSVWAYTKNEGLRKAVADCLRILAAPVS